MHIGDILISLVGVSFAKHCPPKKRSQRRRQPSQFCHFRLTGHGTEVTDSQEPPRPFRFWQKTERLWIYPYMELWKGSHTKVLLKVRCNKLQVICIFQLQQFKSRFYWSFFFGWVQSSSCSVANWTHAWGSASSPYMCDDKFTLALAELLLWFSERTFMLAFKLHIFCVDRIPCMYTQCWKIYTFNTDMKRQIRMLVSHSFITDQCIEQEYIKLLWRPWCSE